MNATSSAAGLLGDPSASEHVLAVNYDAVRGVLILVVMLDHNDIIRNVRSVDLWFLPMTFHVAGFLMLPFLVPRKAISIGFVIDHAVRYLTPFLVALIIYAAAFHVLVTRGNSIGKMITDVGTGFVMADPTSLHVATGFIVLWFLPALLSLVVLLSIYVRVAPVWRLGIFCVASAIHVTVGGFTAPLKQLIPQGLLIAIYIFPLGLAIRQLMLILARAKRMSAIAAVCVVAVCVSWIFECGHEIEVATLVVPAADQPLWVLATDVSDLCFMLALVICSPFLKSVPGLALLGKYSLTIYLVHPLLYKPILGVMAQFCTLDQLNAPATTMVYWAGAAVSVAVVAGASLLVAITLEACPAVRKLVMPRNLRDWGFGAKPVNAAAAQV